ncbi:Sec-independent protein translocase protein TatA [Streptomyces rimosus subsp. rimosus]
MCTLTCAVLAEEDGRSGQSVVQLRNVASYESGKTARTGDRRRRNGGKAGRRCCGNGLEPWHLLIVALVVILLFGSKKLPEMARALGKSLRILKSETKAMKDETPEGEGTGAVGDRPCV